METNTRLTLRDLEEFSRLCSKMLTKLDKAIEYTKNKNRKFDEDFLVNYIDEHKTDKFETITQFYKQYIAAVKNNNELENKHPCSSTKFYTVYNNAMAILDESNQIKPSNETKDEANEIESAASDEESQ